MNRFCLSTGKFIWVALMGLMTSSCMTVGPEYARPSVDTGKNWVNNGFLTSQTNVVNLSHWWTALNDDVLSELIDKTLSKNLDLKQAAENIEASRALLSQVEAKFGPVLQSQGSAQRQRMSANAPEFSPLRSPNQTIGDIGFNASWEIDLFGSLHRQRESVQAQMNSALAGAYALRLSVTGEVARQYFIMRGAQEELRERESIVQLLEDTLALTLIRVHAGDTAQVEVERVSARVTQAKAALAPIQARLHASVLALALLAGEVPEFGIRYLHARVPPLPNVLAIPLGQRADLLRRRPDVLAAEQRLISATADVGVATAELFPKLTLTASAGFRALSPTNLLDTDSRRASVQPLLTWRMFDGGRVKAEIKAADAYRKAAAFAYEHSVLAALSDAETAVRQYEESIRNFTAQNQTRQSKVNISRIADIRYQVGDISKMEWLDAQRELAEQNASTATAQTAMVIDLVRLFKSLGGGWIVS